MLEVAIHRAMPRDARVMAVLHASSFPKPWDETVMAQFIAGPDTVCLIASSLDGSVGSPFGFVIARRAADEAELLTLAVAPYCRRAGLGKTLLRAAMAMLGEAGVTQLFLEVEEGNEAAFCLYRALGAKAVGRRPRYYDSGADAAIFSLALSPRAADDGSSQREA
jgi:[ribosomal protein S18]-alanine N-acetyltransferase